MEHYRKFSTYMKEKYGEKVYKLPINLPVTCPNRDGKLGKGGCTFCGEIGTGFESADATVEIKKQLISNKDYISKRYNAEKFIAYFQNFTNTYLEVERLKEFLEQACIDAVVELSISTRPDCINDEVLEVINDVSKRKNVNITIELGLQSINHETLRKINRGHTLAEFLDAVMRIKRYNFDICVHIIGNLPWDTTEDLIETAKIMSALEVRYVKVHSLYILENTQMAKEYLNDEFTIISKEEYITRIIKFLKVLRKDIVVQRLLARAPKEKTVFCNWSTSWRKIQNKIDQRLEANNIFQGELCDYLNGKALKK